MVYFQILLGLSSSQVDYITSKYKLQKIKHDNLVDALKFFHENGFSKEEVLAHPPVLKFHPATLEQKYLLLKESGFLRVSPTIIARYLIGK